MSMRSVMQMALVLGLGWALAATPAGADHTTAKPIARVTKSEAQWKRALTPDQYTVLRLSGTDRPYIGKYVDFHKTGTFRCVGCGLEVFRTANKYDSNTGWPSFWQPIAGHVAELPDTAHGMSRTEVECVRCGGHLGHVFNDGPEPTGLRYCINSTALKFVGGW